MPLRHQTFPAHSALYTCMGGPPGSPARSTDSQLEVLDNTKPSSPLSFPFARTHPVTPSRLVFLPARPDSGDEEKESLWAIRKCDAFDEGDEDL